MANQFPSNLYSGGAVVFDSTPATNFYIKALQYKRAKQDAVDNWFRDLGSKLTPAGMDNQDVPDWMGKVNAWNDFIAKNKDVLSNPRNPNYAQAYTQSQQLYNDALGFAESSKNKIKELNQFNQLRLSHPDYQMTDATMQALHNATLPLNKGYTPFDWSVAQFEDKPPKITDLKGYQDFVTNGMHMSNELSAPQIDPRTKSKYITSRNFYTNADINKIHDNAIALYRSNRGFQTLTNNLMADPNMRQQMNDKFKAIYGHDLDIQHPEEFAAMLLMPQTEYTEQKPYNYSPTNIKINIPKQDEVTPSLDNYIAGLQQSAQQNPRTFILKGKQQPTMYEVPKSAELSNAFAAKSGTQTLYPDQVLITSDGNFLPVFYKYEGGKPILDKNGRAVVDQTLTHPVSMQEGRIRLAKELFGQAGVKNVMKSNQTFQAPRQQTEKTYKAGNKSYTHKQLLDLGYTEEQIQQAIKLGNLK